MAISMLDETPALILVDLQKGLCSYPLNPAMDQVLGQARALARAWRSRGLPVVLVNVAGAAPGRTGQARRLGELPPDWLEFAPELEQKATDHLVTKRTWGAFTHTGLEQHLKGLGVTQVVIAGVATSVGVESTARQAHELGFNVALAQEAMADMSPEAHANSISRIFPKLGEIGTTREIIDALEGKKA